MTRSMPLYQWLLENSHLVQLARQTIVARSQAFSSEGTAQQIPDHRTAMNGVDLVERMFLRIRDWCSAHRARLLVVTTGFQDRVWAQNQTLDQARSDPDRLFFSTAATSFAKAGVPFTISAMNLPMHALHGVTRFPFLALWTPQ